MSWDLALMNDTLCSLTYHFKCDSVVNEKALTANQGVYKKALERSMRNCNTLIVAFSHKRNQPFCGAI